MQLLKNHAAEVVKKRPRSRQRTPHSVLHTRAYMEGKKSIDCRIEATLKGRRLLSLTQPQFISVKAFRLHRMVSLEKTPETWARRVFSAAAAERVARAMFAQHDPHIISTPLFDIPIFVGEHLLTRLPSIHPRPQSPFKG
jgi:hypothetical protein